MSLRIIPLLCIALLLAACDHQTRYHSFQALPSEGWLRGDTLCFEVEVADSMTAYDLSVQVRNRNDYLYPALPLFVCCDAPSLSPLFRDTVQATLNDGSGDWTGSGFGTLFQSAIPVGVIPIDSAGIYRIKVAHALPDECLKGISDIGIRLRIKN